MTNPLYDRLFGCHEDSTDPFLRLPDGSVITYGSFIEMAGRLAEVLVGQGLRPGDRLAVQVGNHLKRWRSMRRRSGRVLSSCRSIRLHRSGNGIFHHRQRCPHGGDRG